MNTRLFKYESLSLSISDIMKMIDESHDHSRGLPPTIPPPEWISNVTCYSPLLVDDHLALENLSVTTWTVVKAMLIVTSTTLSIALNFVFLVNTKFSIKFLIIKLLYKMS